MSATLELVSKFGPRVKNKCLIQNDTAFLPLSEGYKPSPSWPKLDDGIHWINLYPVDNAFGFPITYLLDQRLN